MDPIIERVHLVRRKRTPIIPPLSEDLLLEIVASGRRLPERQLMHFHQRARTVESALAASR